MVLRIREDGSLLKKKKNQPSGLGGGEGGQRTLLGHTGIQRKEGRKGTSRRWRSLKKKFAYGCVPRFCAGEKKKKPLDVRNQARKKVKAGMKKVTPARQRPRVQEKREGDAKLWIYQGRGKMRGRLGGIRTSRGLRGDGEKKGSRKLPTNHSNEARRKEEGNSFME